MSKRKVYFDILGISPTTDKSAIKKAYRKLALKYHPDISEDPNASTLFIKINEAYEIVSGIRLAEGLKNKNKEEKPTPSPEELLAYKLKQARQRYDKMIKEEEAREKAYHDFYYTGWRWIFFKIVAIYILLFNLFIIADYFLPAESYTLSEDQFIPNYWSEGIAVGEESFSIVDYEFWVDEYPPIQMNRSFFFNDMKSITYLLGGTPNFKKNRPSYKMRKNELFIHYKQRTTLSRLSIYSLFPVMNILMLIPICLVIFKRVGFWFNILKLISIYIIFTYTLCISIPGGRLLHLLQIID